MPGSGSVSALAGVLAAAMALKSINCTIGKEKFKHKDARLGKIREECEKCRETLLFLMEEDITVYRKLVGVYGLPKSTEAEKLLRFEALQKAYMAATEVPVKTALCCLRVLDLNRELVDIVNPNLIPETGVAGFLAEAAFQSARLNIDANLTMITNPDFIKQTHEKISLAEKQAKAYFCETQEKVLQKTKGQ